MTPQLRARLTALPRLDPGQESIYSGSCKICGSAAAFYDVADLQKHCGFEKQYQFGLSGIQVPYLRCDECGFLFTRFFDDWTSEDWARFIYNDDYIRVDPEYTGARSTRLAQTIASLLRGCEKLRILDYGAGAGVFADRMRAAGFGNIDAYDPFSCPARPDGPYDIVTCLEVLEHTPSPLATMADIGALLCPDGCLLFSQTVQPADIDNVRAAWWYLAPRNGHISTFTVETLTRMLPSPMHKLYGNGWLWAMAPPNPAGEAADFLPGLGPVIQSSRLAAPATNQEDLWYPAEDSGGRKFRWAKSARLEWHLPDPSPHAVKLHLRLPFFLEVREGFAAACRMSIGGETARTWVTKSAIRSEIYLKAGMKSPTIVCETPPPCSPFDLRGAPDARRLGLAVPVR